MGRHVVFPALAALAVACHAAGPGAFALLAYRRSSVLGGEVWRLVTTHLVHAGARHLVWNVAAAGLVWLAVGRTFTARVWACAAAAVALGSSLGVLLLQPDVRAMSGLSALLQGLLAAGAAAEVRRGERLGWLLLALLAVKVAWEQLAGGTPLGRAALGGEVAVGAHTFGTVAGVLAGLLLPVEARPAPGAPAPSAR
jgi:rhomboid family GlyGly-CTERM serine protease